MNPYNSLTKPRPWYSRYGNDLFKDTIYTNSLSTATMGTNGLGITPHILGNRHYELTNHLGNVQATVVDRTTPILKPTDSSLIGYHAEISTAQDYYPFGMLMPGRYTSDTARQCVTINTVVMMPRNIRINAGLAEHATAAGVYSYTTGSPYPPAVQDLPKAASFSGERLHLYHYNDASSHPESWVMQTNVSAVDSFIHYDIDLSDEPSGITAYLQLHMDTSQTDQLFAFEIEQEDGYEVAVRVRQYEDSTTSDYYELVGWTDVTSTSGIETLHEVYVGVDKTAVLAGGKTVLEFIVNATGLGNFATNQRLNIYTPYTRFNQLVPTNVVTKLCDDDGDYRFGFNGQEKVNEVAGLGNHNTALFWEYDTRLGRRWNVDPVIKPYLSSYSALSNNPIWKIDPDGDDDFFNSKGQLLWRGKINRNDNRIQIVEVPDKQFIEALSLAAKKYNGDISRMNSFMRAYSHDITSTPIANKDGSITEDGKTVARIANFYKREMGLNEPLSFQFNYLEEGVNAQTSGPPYYTDFNLDITSRTLKNKDFMYVGNFKSLITHEYFHPYMKEPGFSGNYNLYHLIQYKHQTESPSWNETTDNYRKSFAKTVGNYLGSPGKESDRKSFKQYFEKKLGVKYQATDKGTFKIGSETYKRE